MPSALLRSCRRLPGRFAVAHRSLGTSTTASATAAPQPPPEKKLLIFGGTGFVGSRIASLALADGWKVTSLSRRGTPADGSLPAVDWRCGDATEPDAARFILEEGGYNAVVHAIGLLFEGDANKYVSGSGSVPSAGSTYDKVTRQTAQEAIAAAAELCAPGPAGGPPAFLFCSAAEAGWTFTAPVGWLERYLVAKRAVEASLLAESRLRGIILRPSLVYSLDRPLALPSVAAFYAANAIGLPFVDRPVSVDTLAAAAVRAIGDPSVAGVQRYPQMEALAKMK